MFADTHCHIHESEFFTPEAAEAALASAVAAGVTSILCVGTSLAGSREAIAFSKKHHKYCRASVGIHPHEGSKLTDSEMAYQLAELAKLATQPEVVAIGECGFDFYYNDRQKVFQQQQKLLHGQLAIATEHNLPLSFHVREGFDDFWSIINEFTGVRGVLHSFTDSPENLQKGLRQGLYIGVNGIATFTSHQWQRDLFKTLPIEKIVVETDAPFLTPIPKRGTINLPENVIYITKFLAELRGEDADHIRQRTSDNARRLFGPAWH